jgi:hypothetical protein
MSDELRNAETVNSYKRGFWEPKAAKGLDVIGFMNWAEFSVGQNNNHLYSLHASYVDGRLVVCYSAYRGHLWIDKSTLRLLRADREAMDIPLRFPIGSATTRVDYSNVALGDGTSFVLPHTADFVNCSPDDGMECDAGAATIILQRTR